MKDKILKWWNREWSDWSPYKIVNTFSTDSDFPAPVGAVKKTESW